MFRNLSGLLVVLFACCVSGCGNEFGKSVAVTGKVTLGGKPVDRARIIFNANDKKLPAELRNVTGELKSDGTYSLENVYPTEYTVMLETTEGMDATKSAEPAPSPLTPYGPGSPLRAKVTAEKIQFNFDLPAASGGGAPGGGPEIPGSVPM